MKLPPLPAILFKDEDYALLQILRHSTDQGFDEMNPFKNWRDMLPLLCSKLAT